jgi:hypothetical protein
MTRIALTVIGPLALALSYGCSEGRVERREYRCIPELVEDSRFSASEGLIERDGPLLVLHLREPGKPDFAQDIFVRKYGLETVDPTASYVFNVRIEHIESRNVQRREIERITKNGKQIYP